MSTFKAIDHAEKSGAVAGTTQVFNGDMGPLVLALKDIAKAFQDLKVHVTTPEPHVVQVAPTVKVEPTTFAPEITVKPADTVVMPAANAGDTKIEVLLPQKPILIAVSVPSILLVVDIILRLWG